MQTTTTLAAKVAAKFNLPAQDVERALQLREDARRRQLEQDMYGAARAQGVQYDERSATRPTTPIHRR